MRHPNFSLVRRPAAPDDLWDLTLQYWDHDGVDENGKPRWANPIKSLNDSSWPGGMNVAAGAGGIATLEGENCPRCGVELTLTSRTGYEHALAGRPDGCRSCTATFEDRVAGVLDPANIAKAAVRAERREQTRQRQEAEQRVRAEALSAKENVLARRRAAIAAAYPSARDEMDFTNSSVRTRVASIALAEHFGDGGVVGPLDDYETNLAPTQELTYELIAETQGGQLVISPMTPPRAFLWAADAGADADVFEGRHYPTYLILTVGDGAPTQGQLDELVVLMQDYLDPTWLTRRDQQELLDLAGEIVAAEAFSYFEFLLDGWGLPKVADQHRQRAMAMLIDAAADVSLGHLYRAVWTSGSAANNLRASRPTMSRVNVTTFAVNQLEATLQKHADPHFVRLERYRQDSRHPFSAVTTTLFHRVLRKDPMTATVEELRASLPEPADARNRRLCFEAVPEGAAAAESIRVSGTWTGEQFRAALSDIEMRTVDVCAPGCAHDRQAFTAARAGKAFDAIAMTAGTKAAARALIETIPWLNFVDASAFSERPGDLLLNLVAAELGVLEPRTDGGIEES